MMRSTFSFLFLLMLFNCENSTDAVGDASLKTTPHVVSEKNKLSKEQQLMASRIDSMFKKFYQMRQFNGAVLVAKAGKIIYKNNFGIQNKSDNSALNDSSMFQLASISKVITATAVLLLHERKLINLNKDVSEYLPDFPYKNIKVKELLSHRSGLPNYLYVLNSELYIPEYRMSNEDMYKRIVAKKPGLYYKPNRRFNYCNTNYALLALLVEKISGKPYSQFLKDEIFTPLGMKHTATIRDINLEEKNVTRPYDQRWRPVDFDASDYVLGDKSIYSTAYDLFLFSEAMYQNRILKPETQALAYTAFSKEIRQHNYGYGWRMKNFKDPIKKEVYHNGWWHGYRTAFHRRLSDTLTVVILSNQLNKTTYHTYKVYDILDNTNQVVLGEDVDQ
ncbi:MAG: beta-lactamase family protein [Bacteroidia bacterium]|nr:beta-lactamase family protein [Bacteroidia bacterium]